MALQHHEFELRLRDAERLRLYVQAGMAEREMQRASLKKVEMACRRLELEARESVERAIRAEAKRDATRRRLAMAKLATEGAVNTRAQIESELAWVQRALALAEEAHQKAESEHGATREALALAGEACRKAEEESGRLADERLSLVMELGAVREKAVADRETMEAEFDSSATHCSITAMVIAFSFTTFAGVCLISRMECRILLSRLPQNSLPTPDAPQASCQLLQPRNQLRSI